VGYSETGARTGVFHGWADLCQGRVDTGGKAKKADYVLYYKPNIPIAIIEAKKNTFSVGAGMQQALDYADILDLPVAFSSNGDRSLEHDKSGFSEAIEPELSLDDFPSPDEFWQKYKRYKGIETPEAEKIASFDYFFDSKGAATSLLSTDCD